MFVNVLTKYFTYKKIFKKEKVRKFNYGLNLLPFNFGNTLF